MDQEQQNRLSMNKAVADTLDANSGLWTNMPAFGVAVAQLKASITARDKAAGTQSSPTTGITMNKEADAADAVNKVTVLAGNTTAYAMDANMHDLIASLSFGRHYLLHLPDNEQYAVLNTMMEEIAANQANTAGYGVTPGAVNEALNAVNKLRVSHTLPRVAIDNRATATKSIPSLEADSRHALGKIDLLMRNFQLSHPGFYQQYRQARIIVNSGR